MKLGELLKSSLTGLLVKEGREPSLKAPGAETVRRVISEARHAADLVGRLDPGGLLLPVSLGQNCNTAWYLKSCGLKTASYPFDWVFSSAPIAEACLKDRFATFLDRKLIIPGKDSGRAGHCVFHSHMFNHRSPLKSDGDYGYYVRCVERFNELFFSGAGIMFVCTLINELEKRPDWSGGFRDGFRPPSPQSHPAYARFIEMAKKLNGNVKFIFIEQYTEQAECGVSAEAVNDGVLSIRHAAHGRNNGVRYLDEFDDFIARLIYSGMVR